MKLTGSNSSLVIHFLRYMIVPFPNNGHCKLSDVGRGRHGLGLLGNVISRARGDAVELIDAIPSAIATNNDALHQ